MALSVRNFCCFCGIWVYTIVIITASPTNRRAIAISESNFSANATQNNSDCEYNGRTFNNGERINTSDKPCEVCYCKSGDVMCTTVGCYERDDCMGTTVPGSCCPKYDHCPPLDANNKNVEIRQMKPDLLSLHSGSRGLQSWSLSTDSVTSMADFSSVPNESDTTTNHPEMTIIMKRINNNIATTKDEPSENVTFETTDTVDPFDVDQKAFNMVKIVTQPETPSTKSQKSQTFTNTKIESPTIVPQCAHITPASSDDLIAAVFANTEVTEKLLSISQSSSTPQTAADSMKPLIDMEKSTMAILQQLLDVKTTIEPIAAETMETVDAETVNPAAVVTFEQIAAKSSEEITTTEEQPVTTTHSLFSLLGNNLTVHATVTQPENESRQANNTGNVKITQFQSSSDVISHEGITADDVTENAIVRLEGKDTATVASVLPTKLNEQEMRDNGMIETIVTATANVTVVDDPAEVRSTATALPPTESKSSFLPNFTNDVPEIAQVVLTEKNFNVNNTWEDLGTVVAHVTVSYKEESKADSGLSSSSYNEGSSTSTNADLLNLSEMPLLLSTTTEKDNITKENETSSLSDIHTNFNGTSSGDKKLTEVVNVMTDSYIILPLVHSTDVNQIPPIFLAQLNDPDYRNGSDSFNLSLPQSENTQNYNQAAFSSQDVDTTIARHNSSNGIPFISVEFTTLQTIDSSTDSPIKKINCTSSTSTTRSALPSSSTELTVPPVIENSSVVNTVTNNRHDSATSNGNNLVIEVEKANHQDTSTSNEKLPVKISTTIEDVVFEEGGTIANMVSTDVPTTMSTPLTQNKTKETLKDILISEEGGIITNNVSTDVPTTISATLTQTKTKETTNENVVSEKGGITTDNVSVDVPTTISTSLTQTKTKDTTHKDVVISEEVGIITNNVPTDVPTTISIHLPQTETEIPATYITRISENIAKDTTTVPPYFVDSVTFTNQIRLDVADQLPQSFFVESFLSPYNYSTPSSEQSPNNDFPLEIFFKTNLTDPVSTTADNLNLSTMFEQLSDEFNSTSVNMSTTAAKGNASTENSNYTKIFAQKVVLHPTKLLNSVNSVYLSSGLSFHGVTQAASTSHNETENSNSVANFDESNSTEPWNSTEVTTVPYELTTIAAFEDTKSAADSPWRNVSLSNYKILLDSLTEGKVKPLTKVPKVTVAPLSWLKHSAPTNLLGSIANLTGTTQANINSYNVRTTKKTNASVANFTANSIVAVNDATSKNDQPLKNESRTESAQAKVYDPLMPYPEEYPEEYQTIQNGPAIIITRTTYTRIPDVTYTTVTMATLPTYQQVQKAEDGFANTLFERKFRERSFSNDNQVDSSTTSSSDTGDSATTTETPNRYFNIEVKKIEDTDAPLKRNHFRGKSTSDRRMPDPPLNYGNLQKTSSSTKGNNIEKDDSMVPVLDEKDMKIVQNFMNKHLRFR